MNNLTLLAILLVGVASTVARPSDVAPFSMGEGNRLIKTSEAEPAVWLSEDEIFDLIRNKVNFMDVTDRKYPTLTKDGSAPNAYPTALSYRSAVTQAISKLSSTRLQTFVSLFDDFHNRYYQSATGVEASNWLVSQATQAISSSGYQGVASVHSFEHSWAQNSVIARIQGSEDGVVVIGAHLDSVNLNGASLAAPGADDNASGSATVFEAFRAILESGFIPKNSIEFHWYSAEEVGLRGSQDIAQRYSNTNVNVLGMVNFDVDGYNVGQNQVSFRTDYTDRDLTNFLKLVVDGYLDYSWTTTTCGYSCSDHASWATFGFPAAFPSEAIFSPFMHSTSDTISTVNFNQVLEFAKLAVGFAIEISEPRT